MKTTWDRKTKTYRRTARVAAGVEAMEATKGPDGRSRWESGDCIPTAISFATGIPYWRVTDALYAANAKFHANHWSHRKHQKHTGWYGHETEDALKTLGVDFVEEARGKWEHSKRAGEYVDAGYYCRRLPDFVNVSPTLTAVLDGEAREGRYLFSQNGHLIGVVDGVPHHCTYSRQATGRRARCQRIYLLIQE